MSASSERLVSLDAFRGATIASMMVVNNLGSYSTAYPFLLHAQWHGWTFTDTIFPFFLWIVGVAMTFSYARRVERGDDQRKLLLHTFRRAAVIFLLGLLLNGFPRFDLSSIRIPGVLQRIAVCYLIAGVILLYTKLRAQIVFTAAFLAVYWMLMTLVPVPGFGPGVLTREGNFSAWVDWKLLAGHMYSQTRTWDPEGIVSTLPAIATTLLGVLTGHLLRSRMAQAEKAAWMAVGGALFMWAGALLDLYMPINKMIWTTSYSLFMAGLAALALACFYWLVDVQGWRRWARPFAIYGMNAITVYVLSGLLARIMGMTGWKRAVYSAVFTPLFSPRDASMLYGVAVSLVLFLVAWVMHRRGWIVRI
jgi:predicted acyltransferase